MSDLVSLAYQEAAERVARPLLERIAQMTDQLTVVQSRCTELLEENRAMRAERSELNQYQKRAMETAVYPTNVGLAYTALGLAGEAGELANKVKKVYRDHGGELTNEYKKALLEELGDTLWYVAAVATEIGVDLQLVALHNLKKLESRKQRNAISGSGDNR